MTARPTKNCPVSVEWGVGIVVGQQDMDHDLLGSKLLAEARLHGTFGERPHLHTGCQFRLGCSLFLPGTG
jgi:hypothetical protein